MSSFIDYSLRRGSVQVCQVLQKTAQRIRRLRADATPVRKALGVDRKRCLVQLLGRIVRSDVLKKTPAAGAARICYDDAVKGPLLGALAGESNRNGHRVTLNL